MTDEAFRLGRCVFAEGPSAIGVSGSSVTLSGDLVAESYGELLARRAQINGMVDNPGEDTVPFYSEDAALEYLNGFYRVTGAQVDSTLVMYDEPTVPYSITLEAVTDFQAPAAEVVWTTVRRTNASSIAPTNHYLRRAMPDGGWRRVQVGSYTNYSVVLNSSDGTNVSQGIASVNTTRVEQFNARPETWYKGVATIELQVDSEWYPLVGTDIPAHAVNPASALRLNNGIVRVSFNVGGDGRIRHELWTGSMGSGSGWVAVDFKPGDQLTYHDGPLTSPVIIRNDRDAVVVRLSGGPSNAITEGATAVTISLLAGELWAGVQIDPARPWAVRLDHANVTPSTNITGGIRSTSTTNGTWSVIGTSATYTTDTTNGAVLNSTSNQLTNFCIAQTTWLTNLWRITPVDIIEDWVATYTARTRVIPK